MPSIQNVNADASFTLNQLNTLIGQEEDNLGPLVALGNDETRTVLSFDMDQPAPTTHATLLEGAPIAGIIAVCQGEVFVSNATTDVYAVRNG